MLKRIFQQIIILIILTLIILGVALHNLDFCKNMPLLHVVCLSFLTSILLVVFVSALLAYFEKVRYLNSPLSVIDKMTGEEFEHYLKLRFEKEGYKVEMTKASQDYGADLVITKRGHSMAIQAKRYDANVGTAAIQEVVAAKEYYQAESCMVVTNSHFTINALNLAEANDVELRDRDDLLKRTLC